MARPKVFVARRIPEVGLGPIRERPCPSIRQAELGDLRSQAELGNEEARKSTPYPAAAFRAAMAAS